MVGAYLSFVVVRKNSDVIDVVDVVQVMVEGHGVPPVW